MDARFERILVEYAGAFSRLAAAYEPDLTMREDLVQEIALAVWRALPSFRGESSERTFLYRIAHNRALTHISKRRTQPANLEDFQDVPASNADPEEAASSAQLRARLEAATSRLPMSISQVLVLALEGLSNTQIAEVLGITENNVGVRLSRGRERLRSILRQEQ